MNIRNFSIYKFYNANEKAKEYSKPDPKALNKYHPNLKQQTLDSLLLGTLFSRQSPGIQALKDLGAKSTIHSTVIDESIPLQKRIERLKSLKVEGADFNAKAQGGLTALHYVVNHEMPIEDKIKTIKALKELGANLEAITDDGRPLPIYVVNQYINSEHKIIILKTLKELGVDLTIKDKSGFNVLDHISNDTVISVDEKIKTLKGLVTCNLNLDAHNIHGYTPLGNIVSHEDISFERIEAIKALLAAGAKINSICRDGRTPLHIIIDNESIPTNEKVEIIKVLMTAGANVHAENASFPLTPLKLAKKIGDSAVIKALVEKPNQTLTKKQESIPRKKPVTLSKNLVSTHKTTHPPNQKIKHQTQEVSSKPQKPKNK